MLIDGFDVVFETNKLFSPAEIQLGIAKVFNYVHIRNARGSEKDWIRFRLCVEGSPSRAVPVCIGQLPANDSEQEELKSKNLENTFRLRPSFSPRRYSARIEVTTSITSGYQWQTLSTYDFDVLSPDMMPLEYTKAACLPAWVCRNNSDLRAYVNEIAPANLTVEGTARAIYAALCERKFPYQKVVTLTDPRYQYVSGPLYAFEHGGSCVDLSLLFASLLHLHGEYPVLLLFNDHMSVGCFTSNEKLPTDETIQGAEPILTLIERGELLVWDAISVTKPGVSFDKSVETLHLERLDDASSGVCLIQVNVVLENHKDLPFMDPAPRPMLVCRDCGHRFPAPFKDEMPVCPACDSGRVASVAPSRPDPEMSDISVADYDWQALRFKAIRDGLEIIGLQGEGKEEIRIPPVLDGKVVRRIGDRAFMNCKTTRFHIPDTVTEIGDYAFYGCKNLKAIDLPSTLTVLGTAAFSRSGLVGITVPGSVLRLCRLTFSNCEHLSSVTLEEGIAQIDERAFEQCPALAPNIRIPSTAKCAGDIRGQH